MKGTPTKHVYFRNKRNDTGDGDRTVQKKENLTESGFADEVSEGDYMAIVYEQKDWSEGIRILTGVVEKVNYLGGTIDDMFIRVEKSPTGRNVPLQDDEEDTVYFHVNPETGDYYFNDKDPDTPENGWPVARFAWTPEENKIEQTV